MKDLYPYMEKTVRKEVRNKAAKIAGYDNSQCKPDSLVKGAVRSLLRDLYHRHCGLTKIEPGEDVIERATREIMDGIVEKTYQQVADAITSAAFNQEK